MMMNENVYLVDDDLGEISSIHNGNNYSEDELYSENIDSEEEHIEEDIETNITNYSVDELTSIFSIPLPLEKQNIKSIMEKLENETDSVKMKTFYNEVTVKLLNYVRDNEPKPMTIHPVIEGYVNPHMKQIITKMICIDSQFRKDIFHPSHDYTNDLSERVSNVMSVHLNHVEIPNTWYVFHKDKNNTTLHFEITYEFKETVIHLESDELKELIEEMYLEYPKIIDDKNVLYNILNSVIQKRTEILVMKQELTTKNNEFDIETATAEINFASIFSQEMINSIYLIINENYNNGNKLYEDISRYVSDNESKKKHIDSIIQYHEDEVKKLFTTSNIETSREKETTQEDFTFEDIEKLTQHIIYIHNETVQEKWISNSYLILLENTYQKLHTDIESVKDLASQLENKNMKFKINAELTTSTFIDKMVALYDNIKQDVENTETFFQDNYNNNIFDPISKGLEDLEILNTRFETISSTAFYSNENNNNIDNYITLFMFTKQAIGEIDEKYEELHTRYNEYVTNVENANNMIQYAIINGNIIISKLWNAFVSNNLISQLYSEEKENDLLSIIKSEKEFDKTMIDVNVNIMKQLHNVFIERHKNIWEKTKRIFSKYLFSKIGFENQQYPNISGIAATSATRSDLKQSNLFVFQPDSVNTNTFQHNRDIQVSSSRSRSTSTISITSETESFRIEVSNGNYLCNSLAKEVEDKINESIQNFIQNQLSVSESIKNIDKYVEVLYNSKNKKCTIRIIHSNIKQMNITFSDHANKNEREFLYREKVLGHYLGFSNKQIFNGVQLTYDPADVNKRFVESEELMNTFGTKYIYLCMDDFLQNKTTTNIIGLETTRDNLKVPNYYHCDLKQDDYRKLKSEKKSGLTEVKAKAMKSIQQDNLGKIRTKWKSVDDINVFAKIPVKYSPVYSLYDNNEDLMMIQNDTNSINHDITKRDYFGPVELNKVRVYLLDDDGEPLNLNNENWSLSLVCKQNYQG